MVLTETKHAESIKSSITPDHKLYDGNTLPATMDVINFTRDILENDESTFYGYQVTELGDKFRILHVRFIAIDSPDNAEAYKHKLWDCYNVACSILAKDPWAFEDWWTTEGEAIAMKQDGNLIE